MLEKKYKPYLIVFTKCDKTSDKKLDSLIEETKEKVVKKNQLCDSILHITSTK